MTTDHVNVKKLKSEEEVRRVILKVKGVSRKCFHGYLAKGINWLCFKPFWNLHLRRLKKMFRKNLKKCLRKGKNGVLSYKPRKKLGGKLKEINSPHDVNVVSTYESSDREIASFFKASSGLDESPVIAGWDKLDDGPKKRGLEEKLKKIKKKQMELVLLRSRLVADVAYVISK